MNKIDNRNAVLGWQFISKNRKLSYKDGRIVEDGQKLKALNKTKKRNCGVLIKTPTLCKFGMHCSKQLSDAIICANVINDKKNLDVLCRVEVWGHIDDSVNHWNVSNNKICGMYRKVLWSCNIKNLVKRWSKKYSFYSSQNTTLENLDFLSFYPHKKEEFLLEAEKLGKRQRRDRERRAAKG